MRSDTYLREDPHPFFPLEQEQTFTRHSATGVP